MRTAVLISGRGSNLQALIAATRAPDHPAEIALVLSNRPEAAGLDHAREAGIASQVVDQKDYAGPDRTAARAAFDALPFLRNSRQVNVVWIDAEDSAGQRVDLGGSEIATSLARHNVTAEIISSAQKTGGIGPSLKEQVANSGADLIVMGGYGHSRFSEYIFGGATRHMLAQMPVPILISH